MRKNIYFVFGLVCIGMSYVGIILPGIPGIPFILLSAWFLVRSSDRLYGWLLERPLFGKVLKRFGEDGPLPPGFRWFVLSQWWVSIVVAEVFLVKTFVWHMVVVMIGVVGSVLWWRFRR